MNSSVSCVVRAMRSVWLRAGWSSLTNSYKVSGDLNRVKKTCGNVSLMHSPLETFDGGFTLENYSIPRRGRTQRRIFAQVADISQMVIALYSVYHAENYDEQHMYVCRSIVSALRLSSHKSVWEVHVENRVKTFSSKGNWWRDTRTEKN